MIIPKVHTFQSKILLTNHPATLSHQKKDMVNYYMEQIASGQKNNLYSNPKHLERLMNRPGSVGRDEQLKHMESRSDQLKPTQGEHNIKIIDISSPNDTSKGFQTLHQIIKADRTNNSRTAIHILDNSLNIKYPFSAFIKDIANYNSKKHNTNSVIPSNIELDPSIVNLCKDVLRHSYPLSPEKKQLFVKHILLNENIMSLKQINKLKSYISLVAPNKSSYPVKASALLGRNTEQSFSMLPLIPNITGVGSRYAPKLQRHMLMSIINSPHYLTNKLHPSLTTIAQELNGKSISELKDAYPQMQLRSINWKSKLANFVKQYTPHNIQEISTKTFPELMYMQKQLGTRTNNAYLIDLKQSSLNKNYEDDMRLRFI